MQSFTVSQVSIDHNFWTSTCILAFSNFSRFVDPQPLCQLQVDQFDQPCLRSARAFVNSRGYFDTVRSVVQSRKLKPEPTESVTTDLSSSVLISKNVSRANSIPFTRLSCNHFMESIKSVLISASSVIVGLFSVEVWLNKNSIVFGFKYLR